MKREIVGSGMTARAVGVYDPGDPQDRAKLLKDGFGCRIDAHVRELTASAVAFLRRKNLPTEWGMYRRTATGWEVLPVGAMTIPAFGFLDVIRIEAEARDFNPVDSQIAYAARMISHA